MRKRAMSIDEARTIVKGLLGQNLKVLINKGRKRVLKCEGSIDNIFPSVFTVKTAGVKKITLLSFSYSDYICGDVKLSSV